MPHESEQTFRRVEYGTNTRPGATVRDAYGEYFSFDSSRKGVLANVSTRRSALDFLHAVEVASPDAIPLNKDKASMIAISREAAITEDVASLQAMYESDDAWHEVAFDQSYLPVEMPTAEAIALIRSGKIGIAAVRLAYRNFFVTWQAPYARFVDSDHVTAEAGMYVSSSRQLDQMRHFMRLVGKADFLDGAQPHITMRERGVAKHYTI